MSNDLGRAPYLTLEMICGDDHAGGDALGRCLKSVLVRSGGPLVDAIGLTFNGSDNGLEQLGLTLAALGYLVPSDPKLLASTLHGPVPLTLRQCPWPGRFDLARNDGWRHARGEWVLWLDCDDTVADAGTPEGLRAIERVERDYGLVGPEGSGASPPPSGMPDNLKTWLAQLPLPINVVYCPYDYTIDENEYVHVRQKMKRIVRRSAGHVWHSPEQSGIHEVLTAFGGVSETMAETFGLLIQHRPTQSELERVVRNSEIVKKLTRPEIFSDARHAYDVSNAALIAGDLKKANEAISAAIVYANNDMDRYTYRLARAYVGLQENSHEKMLQEAFAAVGILPEIRDAYFIATEAFYHMGKWASVVEWYERGVTKVPTLLSRDQPLASFICPRAQAALAYVNLGRPDKAMELVKEMEKEYPKAGLTVEVGTKIRATAARQKGECALFDALEFMAGVSPKSAKEMLVGIKSTHIFDALRTTMPWKALERRVEQATQNLGPMCFEQTDATTSIVKSDDDGVIGLDDILENVAPLGWNGGPRQFNDAVPQILNAELSIDSRSARCVVRERATKRPQRIAFYAPTGVSRWECSEFDSEGQGGSESSVALLANELTTLGHEVTVFTNKRGFALTSLWRGVIQKDCSQYHPSEWVHKDIVIFCRAPWMVRDDPPATKHVFCWHQDNGYGYDNPRLWSPELVEKQQHLFVSKFAAGSLLHYVSAGSGSSTSFKLPKINILGNGISPDCASNWPDVSGRNLHSVVYASNPSRGLGKLLEAWPEVLKQVPDAQLIVMCEWRVMLLTTQDQPGQKPREVLERLQGQLAASPNTISLGWQPQNRVLEVLKRAAISCYPGGPMPEGFGVALVQAQACGCDVLAPESGGLPEVLGNHYETLGEGQLVTQLIANLQNPSTLDQRKARSAWTLEAHAWPTVARRFLELTGAPEVTRRESLQ